MLSVAPRLVLDADGLNALVDDVALQTLLRQRSARGHHTILTPHPLEAARLLGCSVRQVQSDRLQSARALARKFEAVVVLKGSGSLIAHPDGRLAINPTGHPRLATAGSGDVLAGWIGALMARGHDKFEAVTEAAALRLRPILMTTGAMVLGAVPLATAVAVAGHARGRRLPAFFVRKAAKDHGTQSLVEGLAPGESLKGKRLIIVEDVTTTGGSSMKAIEAVRAQGGQIARAAGTYAQYLGRDAGYGPAIRHALMRSDAVTAVSGSGPAYVFLLVEAFAEAARAQGLDPATADTLARATVTGAQILVDTDAKPLLHEGGSSRMHDRQIVDDGLTTQRCHMLGGTHGEPVDVRITDGAERTLPIDQVRRHRQHICESLRGVEE
mgnify:CR=1 FL=1